MENYKFIDLALYLERKKILIFADFHMGFEESLNEEGLLIPRFQFKETIDRLKKILDSVKVNEIVINGDLKHEFGKISDTEWRYTLELLDFLLTYSKKIVLVRGNHDTILGPIADKKGIKIVDYYEIDDFLICHGDKIINSNCKNIIIGHEHPAISLRNNGREETFKCFLEGKFENKKIIVMPSFNLITEGTNILKEKLLSPYLKKNLDNFKIFIVGDKVYSFGDLKNFKKE